MIPDEAVEAAHIVARLDLTQPTYTETDLKIEWVESK